MRSYILAALTVLALAGCGQQAGQPPTSTAVVPAGAALTGAQPASKEPESANSLPRGAQVDTTLTPAAGNIDTTRVGPATPVRRPATSGY